MKVQPVGARVFAKQIQAPEEMRGGLYIPPTAQDVPQRYEVIAVGQGRWEGDRLRPCVCQPGDHVFISKYTGNSIALPGVPNGVILREEDILAIVRDDPASPAEAEAAVAASASN